MTRPIELLSPARNLICGIEAVNHGADAVYIGASRFGARHAAGNTVSDIEELCRYAHQYRSKVYVTLNTILTDSELEEARILIGQLYSAGIDALIIQDMGLLMLDLPPVPLHASTQTDNRDVEKIRFLHDAGFKRVVLARELSLEQIAHIHKTCDIELESFVHGAVCVSYSGQCYMSRYAAGRSANRGECAQYCRLPYTLQDSNGKMILREKHLLSLKDMNRSDSIESMIRAGVSSLKIEGRLKELSYVKNITAFYRQKLDAILDRDNEFRHASSGKVLFHFIPNPSKSFNRGMTDYFLHGRNADMAQWDTPKSIGEKIGTVAKVTATYFIIDTDKPLANGDGLCFFASNGSLEGFRINTTEGKTIYPARMPLLENGTVLYRNYDQAFEKMMQRRTAERKIGVNMEMQESEEGFLLNLQDEDDHSVTLAVAGEKNFSDKPEETVSRIRKELSKLGNTVFYAQHVDIRFSHPWFIPYSRLAEWRRSAVELLLRERSEKTDQAVTERKQKSGTLSYPEKRLSYLANIMNNKAAQFYTSSGVGSIEPAFEKQAEGKNRDLMFCKYCIKESLGACPRSSAKEVKAFREPLFLKYKDQLFRLEFDCRKCEMRIRTPES